VQFLFLARVVRKMTMLVSDGNISYLVKGSNRTAKVFVVLVLLKKRSRGVTTGGSSCKAAVLILFNGGATTSKRRRKKDKSDINIASRLNVTAYLDRCLSSSSSNILKLTGMTNPS
jgi:hypothetical protein